MQEAAIELSESSMQEAAAMEQHVGGGCRGKVMNELQGAAVVRLQGAEMMSCRERQQWIVAGSDSSGTATVTKIWWRCNIDGVTVVLQRRWSYSGAAAMKKMQ